MLNLFAQPFVMLAALVLIVLATAWPFLLAVWLYSIRRDMRRIADACDLAAQTLNYSTFTITTTLPDGVAVQRDNIVPSQFGRL